MAGGAGFGIDGAFFSGFVTAGVWVAAGSFTAGAWGFGACVGPGRTSAGCFFSGLCFLLGYSSGCGCWAITAPASASEQTISKLVIFFMLMCFGRRRARSIQTPERFLPARASIA